MTTQQTKADATNGEVLVSIAFVKRNPNLTPEQFYDHWENIHGPLVRPWAEKHKFVSYKQMHLKPAMNQGVKPFGPEATDLGAHASLEEYDGCAVFEVLDLEAFAEAFKDPYYIDTIAPDETKFIDKKLGILRARGEVKTIVGV